MLQNFNPSANIEQAASANLDLLLSVAQTALSAAESLMALNLHTAREAFADNAKNAKAMFGSKTPQEAATLQAQLAQPAMEKAVAYSRSVYEISTGATEELNKLFQSHLGDFNKTAQDAARKGAQSSPFGADVMMAMVNQAITAANSAFDNLNKAAQQATEFTQAGMNNVTNAAVKAAAGKQRAGK